jgi:dimethylargininase
VLTAITRKVGPSLCECELTHMARTPIDLDRAAEQHLKYERTLAGLGCDVVSLPAESDLPDSVFVEDTAVVLGNLAVITRPGAESRRAETASVANALAPYRELVSIEEPGTLDGGDVLTVGARVYVGLSGRSNEAGARQLRAHLMPRGYMVEAVPVRNCLHLKSAATFVSACLILVNPDFVDVTAFRDMNFVHVDPSEPLAANALRVGGDVVFPEAYPRTLEKLLARHVRVTLVDVSELAKAEGGVTCCSLVFRTAKR